MAKLDRFIYLFVCLFVYYSRQHMILREDKNWIDLFIYLFIYLDFNRRISNITT